MAETENTETTAPIDPPTTAHSEASEAWGSSPYSTGGGGVTFERKVAVTYLARLLTGDGAIELGDGRRLVSVRFQQAPDHPVDDLVLHAAREDEAEPSLVLALGVRRSPNIVQSDESTTKLITDFVNGVVNAPADGPEHRSALVVAGSQQHAEQLSALAHVAANQMNASEFFDLVRTPLRYSQEIRGRLDQVEGLVKKALIGLGDSNPDDALVRQRVWELLSRLTVLMPRLEAPDETDWAHLVNTLIPVARGGDLATATSLRDRLASLAAEYAPTAATIDLSLVRRDTHDALDSTVRRHTKGWAALTHLHDRAVTAVHDVIASADGQRTVHIERDDAATALFGLATSGGAVVAHGESGVGKSALVMAAATSAATTDPDTTQVLCVNLRDLPATTVEFDAALGCTLATLLAELSAPCRLLVIDSADAVAEEKLQLLRYLIDAAHDAGLGVLAVSANDNKQVVRDALDARFADVVEHGVPALTDAQIEDVVAVFPELINLATNARSRDLLRRPVVIDLLVRSGVSGVPLSDADAMRQVWAGLVRRRELTDRGVPDARDFVLLHLARFALSGGNALEVASDLDATALDGLRRDGLLRASADNEWQILPEFAHDEVRRYAVARVLLVDGDPAAALLAAGAPRWALPAARLACQALLARPDRPATPLHGRVARMQAAFDALVDAGHGARWGDVPAEALLSIGDPAPLLADAWDDLHSDDGAGLKRVARLLDQRHRREAVVDAVVIEPIITLLLDDPTPWWSGDYVAKMLREWLHALIMADAVAGQPLRVRLRERLVAACDAGDARVVRERDEAAARRAARTPEEIEEEHERMERNRALFTAIGHGGRERRRRPDVPQELTDDTMLELLALLGPDLGEDGERILRRVAEDAPWHFAPAVEEVLTGRALASYGGGLLADLTEAYYLDEEDDGGSGLMDDGIRSHHTRGLVTPLHAWYRGPFMPLFQTDLRRGVAVLNRMLNHAALVRARTLAGLHGPWGQVSDEDVDQYKTELHVTGAPRIYVGDGHVWMWYRGTGVGPYPCMSALAALEIVCDQHIEAGAPLPALMALLLAGCENLAMLGLIVGILVRHIERADALLDPYLAEPAVWHLEVSRMVSESAGLAASSEHIAEPERRKWTLREAATWLTISADVERAAVLRTVGDALVANVLRLVSGGDSDGGEPTDPGAIEYVATVRNWASALDRGRYRVFEQDGMTYVQAIPDEEIVAALQQGNKDLERGQHATRIIWRYFIQQRRDDAEPVTDEELATDLLVAKDLLDDPPGMSAYDPWDAPAAVSAVALEAHLLRGAVLPSETLDFAAQTVLRITEGVVPPKDFEYEGTFFEQGADRSAARTIPLLLLPSAQAIRVVLGDGDEAAGYSRVVSAGMRLAHAIADETRLHLARGMDGVWASACSQGTCHHEDAFTIALESMRDCVLGPWNPDHQRRDIVPLDEPYIDALAEIPNDAILMSRLDAAIRACGSAAVADACVSARARDALLVLAAAQRRALLAHKHNYDERGTHTLVTARALLNLAALGEDAPLHEHIAAYTDNATLLGGFLRALAAAAEEKQARADTCRRVWPAVIREVLQLNDAGHQPFNDHYFGDMALASLMPTPTYEASFLYREVDAAPIVWSDPLAWRDEIEAWLTVAAGNAHGVDSLISLLRSLPVADQASAGLPWVSTAVFGDAAAVARGSYAVSNWLIEIRESAVGANVLNSWQRVVDALVVAGDTSLAPYSE